MKTITAKELRNNLDKVVMRARAGETIRVTYRSKPAFTITSDTSESDKESPGSHEAMKKFIASAEKARKLIPRTAFDPSKSIKQLYHEMLDNDPKYKPPTTDE